MELLFLDKLTDKDEQHSYKRVYDKYLSKMGKGKKILEIGVQRGGSIITWAATGADVYGIDLESAPEFLQHPRIHLAKGNAYTVEAVEHFKKQGKYSMIVEDGSHKPEDIVWAAKWYSELLEDDGVMILEDIPDATTIAELKKIRGFYTVEYDLRMVKGRWDDRIVVLERVPK
jgi:cyclopropane fatty-acyl-phospholipid synthase-like methyltransferase